SCEARLVPSTADRDFIERDTGLCCLLSNGWHRKTSQYRVILEVPKAQKAIQKKNLALCVCHFPHNAAYLMALRLQYMSMKNPSQNQIEMGVLVGKMPEILFRYFLVTIRRGGKK